MIRSTRPVARNYATRHLVFVQLGAVAVAFAACVAGGARADDATGSGTLDAVGDRSQSSTSASAFHRTPRATDHSDRPEPGPPGLPEAL